MKVIYRMVFYLLYKRLLLYMRDIHKCNQSKFTFGNRIVVTFVI